MAWIIGALTEDELEQLRVRGWEDEDPPQELIPDTDAEMRSLRNADARDPESEPKTDGSELIVRSFFVDNDVFSIMSGPDWDTGGYEHKRTKATACLACGVVHMPMPVKCGRMAIAKCGCGNSIKLEIEN